MEVGKRLARREVFDGRVVRLSVDRVRLPGGREVEIELIRHGGAAAVVPVDAAGQVLLVRQYRYSTGGFLLEVPAGKLDPGESPEICARREVEEETGHRPGRLTSLGWIWTTPGFTDEKIWLYRADNLTATRQTLQDDEVLEVERLPLGDAIAMARRGDIQDGKSVCALLRCAAG
jgi:ADP-ribose pyrophosphatase